MNPFFLLAIGVAVSMLIIPLAWRLAPHLGMVDEPDARKVHTVPIPRIGGWGIVLGSVVPLVIALKLDPLMQSYLVGSITLFFFGMWDDAKQISHWKKFTGQIFAVGLVVFYGDLYVTRFPFMPGETLDPLLGKPFTMFAIIGMINAINHSDGLDGLAGGETMLSLIAIAFLGHMVSSEVTVSIAFAAMGGILGFLRYNTHPAQVFMGDSGSQFLGFTLGFLAVYVTQVAHPALSSALPLLFLGLPIADILAVLFQRIKGKMNWFRATRNHVHHRLLDLGFHHYETVVIIYSLQAALVVSAVLMRYQSDLLVAGTYFAVIAGLFAGLIHAERKGWRARRIGTSSRLAGVVAELTDSSTARTAPLLLISALIPSFMLLGSLWVTTVPRDFGVVAGVLFLIVAVEIFFNRNPGSVFIRSAMYVTAVFSAYLMIHFSRDTAVPVEALTTAMMIVLAVAVGIFIRFTSDRKFGTTPTDYLIVFGVLALAAFGNTDIKARDTVQLVMYAIVLLYGCEVVIGRMGSRWHILNLATLVTLGILGLRGLVF